AFHNAGRELLPKARPVVDRFHVAQKFNEAIDGQRKKNHPGVPGEAVAGGAEAVPVTAVGVPVEPEGADQAGQATPGGTVPEVTPATATVPVPGTVPEDL